MFCVFIVFEKNNMSIYLINNNEFLLSEVSQKDVTYRDEKSYNIIV